MELPFLLHLFQQRKSDQPSPWLTLPLKSWVFFNPISSRVLRSFLFCTPHGLKVLLRLSSQWEELQQPLLPFTGREKPCLWHPISDLKYTSVLPTQVTTKQFSSVKLHFSGFWGDSSPLARPQEAKLWEPLTLSKAFSVSAVCILFKSNIFFSASTFSLFSATSWSRAALCFSSSHWWPSSSSCCFRWVFTWISSSFSLWIWFSISQITWNKEQRKWKNPHIYKTKPTWFSQAVSWGREQTQRILYPFSWLLLLLFPFSSYMQMNTDPPCLKHR